MYLAKSFRKRVTKRTPWTYYFLRETKWDPRRKRRRNIYLAYIGRYPVITLDKARKIANKLGIELDELARVRGLEIIGYDSK